MHEATVLRAIVVVMSCVVNVVPNKQKEHLECEAMPMPGALSGERC